MPKYHFTSVLSKHHLYRMLALYHSLKAHCSSFELFILCMDDVVYDIFSKINFKNITLVKLEEVEDDEVLKAKSDRSFHEYCWTLKPVILYHVLNNYPLADYYAHLDADLYFYKSPSMIFDENPTASLYLTHHRNSKMFEFTYELTGIYNSGFVGCRNDETAMKAVKQWREKCINHCTLENDTVNKTFGDQRYLEDWPGKFKNVHIVKSLGVNAALWNIQGYNVTLRDNTVYLNNDLLIFYHFTGVAIIGPKEFNLCWYFPIDESNTLNFIYKPYVVILSEAIKEMQKNFPYFSYGLMRREDVPRPHFFVLE